MSRYERFICFIEIQFLFVVNHYKYNLLPPFQYYTPCYTKQVQELIERRKKGESTYSASKIYDNITFNIRRDDSKMEDLLDPNCLNHIRYK